MDEKKLLELKEEFLNIPIPDALQFTVKKALKEGEIINNRKNSWRKWTGAAAITILLLTAALNISPGVSQALADVPIIKNIVSVLTFREYKIIEDNYNANLKVPAVKGMGNKDLENSLNSKYLEENRKLYKEFINDMEDMKKNANGGHLGVDSGYEVKTDNKQILSISRWVVNTVGSSSTTVKFDTIDKQKEVLITLPSLFKDDRYIKIISENIKQQMLDQMKADPNKMYWLAGASEALPSDNFESITRDQNFYINNDGKLVISFDKYAVAPGCMGVVEFIIPTEVIADVLISNEYIK